MPDKPRIPGSLEGTPREEKLGEHPESSLDVPHSVETDRDLSREREADAEHAEGRAQEIRDLIDRQSAPVVTDVEIKKAEYVEKHLPQYLERDHLPAKIHRGIMRAYVEIQEALGMLSVEGRENIPADGPFVVVANHSRPSDDKRIIGILKRTLHIVTADFHFNMTPISRRLMQSLGEIEIRPTLTHLSLEEQEAIIPRLHNEFERTYYRGLIEDGKKPPSLAKHRAFLRTTVAALLKGEPVLLFPEGVWLYEKGEKEFAMKKAYPGIELIAREYKRVSGNDLPIVPVGLSERGVKIGEPGALQEGEDIHTVMRRVAGLLSEGDRGYYRD